MAFSWLAYWLIDGDTSPLHTYMHTHDAPSDCWLYMNFVPYALTAILPTPPSKAKLVTYFMLSSLWWFGIGSTLSLLWGAFGCSGDEKR